MRMKSRFFLSPWLLVAGLGLTHFGALRAAGGVAEPIVGLSLDKSYSLIQTGGLDTLAITLLTTEGSATMGLKATENEKAAGALVWSSDNEAVATVKNGIISALAEGSATIVVATADGVLKAACTVNVTADGSDPRGSGPGGMPGGMPPGGFGGGQGMPGGGQGGPGGMPPGGFGQGQGGPGQGQGMPGGQEGEEMPQGMPPGGQNGEEMPQGMPPGGQNGEEMPQGMPPGGGQGGPGQGQGGFPGGQGGPGGMPGGFGGGGGAGSDNSDASDPEGLIHSEGEESLSGQTFRSSTADANAVKVSGGTLSLQDCTLIKDGGNSSNADGSSFYGTNAAVLARADGTAILCGGSIETSAIGANGIVAYGGRVEASDLKIRCSERLSRGIHTTGGGAIYAKNLDIVTQGANSSVIALDRGGGIMDVTGGNYEANGQDCAVLYSTGDLTVNNITGSSRLGEIGVIEGNNFININNSRLTSHATKASRGLMILQSGSGDAGTGLNGIITVAGGALTMTDPEASLIEIVTNVTGKVTLDGVELSIPSGILMTVDYNKRWQTYGATGVLVLSGAGTTYEGAVVADSFSSAVVTVNEGVTWSGAFDKENSAKATSLTLNGGVWSLTDDSYVDSITLNGEATILKNGHTLTCENLDPGKGKILE